MTIELAERIIKPLNEAKEMIRQGEPGADSWINAAIDEIAMELYLGEFETIGGVWQHPKGYTKEQWIEANKDLFSKTFSLRSKP